MRTIPTLSLKGNRGPILTAVLAVSDGEFIFIFASEIFTFASYRPARVYEWLNVELKSDLNPNNSMLFAVHLGRLEDFCRLSRALLLSSKSISTFTLGNKFSTSKTNVTSSCSVESPLLISIILPTASSNVFTQDLFCGASRKEIQFT